MTFEDDTTCCKMHKLGVFPFFVTIGDILQHKLYSVITIGVMLRINLKLVLVLVLRCNLPSQIVTPLVITQFWAKIGANIGVNILVYFLSLLD